MTDEQLDAALDALREILAAPAGEAANVIDGSAEPVVLPAPEAVPGGYARAQAKALQIVPFPSSLTATTTFPFPK